MNIFIYERMSPTQPPITLLEFMPCVTRLDLQVYYEDGVVFSLP